ncbi:MAG: tRNA pseudouridine(38-40) synthase TruA [Niabella sp.]
MRYFIELSYKGTAYQGFQVQPNAVTIQSELERAIGVVARRAVSLTGSSRTDSGVHAAQNFFHFDWDGIFEERLCYNLNAVLPADIAVRAIHPVPDDAHCRFDALSRTYQYHIYQAKNPFLYDRAWFYPYPLNIELLQSAAGLLKQYSDFTSFSKKNTQVKSFICRISKSNWAYRDRMYVYEVQANRFLRGMVRALVATMLRVGRGTLSLQDFQDIIEARDGSRAFFDAPARGLFLMRVEMPQGLLERGQGL